MVAPSQLENEETVLPDESVSANVELSISAVDKSLIFLSLALYSQATSVVIVSTLLWCPSGKLVESSVIVNEPVAIHATSPENESVTDAAFIPLAASWCPFASTKSVIMYLEG